MTEWASNIVADTNVETVGPVASDAFEDAALLAACRKGQMDAFGILVQRYQDRVFNAILRMCGNRDDAEELCQEAFVKALENLSRFREDSRFYTWLFRIAANLTISRRRRGGRVKFHSLDGPVGRDDQSPRPRDMLPDGRENDPAEAVAQEDVHERVLEELAGLDDEFRAVVVMRDVEGMNYDEIAEVLKIPHGTVKSRLYRARLLLQERLQGLIT